MAEEVSDTRHDFHMAVQSNAELKATTFYTCLQVKKKKKP